MRVLVAYDGSPAADTAIDQVLLRPWPAGTQIHVVTVLETPILYPMSNGMAGAFPPLNEAALRSLREGAETSVRDAALRLAAKRGVVVSHEVREGDVKGALLDAIRERRCDLVIVGSHGKGAFGRLFLGSVSHALVTHAPCNVEVVRPAGAAA